MNVESWGRPYMPSNCTPDVDWDSTNVKSVKFPNGAGWKNTDDHSKWAVSYNSSVNVACPSDLNRMTS